MGEAPTAPTAKDVAKQTISTPCQASSPSEPFTCLCCHWLAARQKIQVKVVGVAPTAKNVNETNGFNSRPDPTAKPLPLTQVPRRKRLFANCSASGQQATLSQRYTSAPKLSCHMVFFGAPCPVQNRTSGAFLCLSGCWSSESVD